VVTTLVFTFCVGRALAALPYNIFAIVPMSSSDSDQSQSTSSKGDMTSALQAGIAKGKKSGNRTSLKDLKNASREAVRGLRSGQVCLNFSDIECLVH
jgi:hypothetical protein